MLAHRRLINPKKPNENSCKNGVFPEFVFMFEKKNFSQPVNASAPPGNPGGALCCYLL
jgi:hypothetical protein